MKTTLDMPDELIWESRTKTAAVIKVLKELTRQKKIYWVLSLGGATLDFEDEVITAGPSGVLTDIC